MMTPEDVVGKLLWCDLEAIAMALWAGQEERAAALCEIERTLAKALADFRALPEVCDALKRASIEATEEGAGDG